LSRRERRWPPLCATSAPPDRRLSDVSCASNVVRAHARRRVGGVSPRSASCSRARLNAERGSSAARRLKRTIRLDHPKRLETNGANYPVLRTTISPEWRRATVSCYGIGTARDTGCGRDFVHRTADVTTRTTATPLHISVTLVTSRSSATILAMQRQRFAARAR
jgi:hypothetical protein